MASVYYMYLQCRAANSRWAMITVQSILQCYQMQNLWAHECEALVGIIYYIRAFKLAYTDALWSRIYINLIFSNFYCPYGPSRIAEE